MRPQTRKIAELVRATVKRSGFWDTMVAQAKQLGGGKEMPKVSPNFIAGTSAPSNPDATFRGQKLTDLTGTSSSTNTATKVTTPADTDKKVEVAKK